VLGGALFVAGVARALAVPGSFGAFGHWRGEAPFEARQLPVRHQGRAACAECHDEKVALNQKDLHSRVQCEDCHGAADRHVAAQDKVDKDGNRTIAVPRGRDMCLVCHRRLTARPGPFPQIVPEEHFKLVGVRDPQTECTQCHDPHEPLFLDRDIHDARLHPLVQRCRDCHQGRVDEKAARPASHPAIFECAYCHKDVAKSFAGGSHKGVRCTTCHIFSKDTDFSGRIIRDADPRFCLLCHKKAPFRSDDAPPSIDWAEHRSDVGAGDDARCVDCHQDRIHDLFGGKR